MVDMGISLLDEVCRFLHKTVNLWNNHLLSHNIIFYQKIIYTWNGAASKEYNDIVVYQKLDEYAEKDDGNACQ